MLDSNFGRKQVHSSAASFAADGVYDCDVVVSLLRLISAMDFLGELI